VGGRRWLVIADRCRAFSHGWLDLNAAPHRPPEWCRIPQPCGCYEPGLAELVERCRGPPTALSSYGGGPGHRPARHGLPVGETPTKNQGQSATGEAPDLRWIEAFSRQWLPKPGSHDRGWRRAPCPVRTAKPSRPFLRRPTRSTSAPPPLAVPKRVRPVLFHPEFLRGTAI